MYTEKQCGRVLNRIFGTELAEFAIYQIQLAVIYTDGKDFSWSKWPSGKDIKGVMTGAFLIPDSRIASGGTLIDLKACAESASCGKLSINAGFGGSPPTFQRRNIKLSDLRFAVISTLAHEIFHMIQSWRGGDIFEGKKIISPTIIQYTRIYNRLENQMAHNHPSESDNFIRTNVKNSNRIIPK